VTKSTLFDGLSTMAYAGGEPSGMAPICCIKDITSMTPQCSCARPSSPNRTMSMAWTSMRLPLAGTPMKSFLLVPVMRTRATTLSPLSRISSASKRKSEASRQHGEQLLGTCFGWLDTRTRFLLDEIIGQKINRSHRHHRRI
jgi:hypothetical protein